MKNYGEELAYWYLRLNGFFVLDNFVYHRTKHNRNSDADLLAIRLPYVKEPVGGNIEDWDEKLFSNLNEYDVLGVLCEVKTGPRPDLSRKFENQMVNYALNRIGFSEFEVKNMLYDNDSFFKLQHNKKQFLKLLISEHRVQSTGNFLAISLEHIESFIYKRIDSYSREKYNARHFFSSPLIQYMMYRRDKR